MAVPDNTRPPAALPPGTRLDEFELRRVLGIGGFGIVYLAFDHALEREVAIKEYMPSSLVGRSGDGLALSLLSEAHAASFALGRRSFVNEARLLARFDAPGLVKVHRYWEANNTAYMAMPFYAGSNLHAVRRRMDGPPDEAWLRGVLQPLLDALERLHREGVYHRDVSPDNVLLQPDGQPVLLDFGAARQVLTDKSVALTAILKPAYAPIEQYAEAGAVRQGAWTDLYALGATLHFLLLGKSPPPATARAVDDGMPPLAGQAALLARCTPGFLQAIDWMLRPRPADRPQSVAALRSALAPRGDALAERTVLDLSRLHAAPHAPHAQQASQPQDDAPTVLLPRPDAATGLPPSQDAPTGLPPRPDAPTVRVPRRPEAAAPRREDPTILMPPPAPTTDQDAVGLLLPLDELPGHRPAAADLAQPPTLRMPPPAPADATAAEGLHAIREAPLPRPASGARPALVGGALLALAGVGVAAWLALKAPTAAPAAALPAAAASALAAGPAPSEQASGPASVTAGAQAEPASGPSAVATQVPAPAPDAAPARLPADPPATSPTTVSATPPTTGAATAAIGSAGKAPIQQPTPQTAQRPANRPAPDAAMRSPRQMATPAEPAPATAADPTPPAANSGPPSLATSITRLPPATEPTGVRPAPELPRSAAASAATTAPAAAPAAPPAATTAPRGTDTPVPRATQRDAEPVPLQARALSPAERCDGRNGAALGACIDRICRAEPGLRDQADCVRARRDGTTP